MASASWAKVWERAAAKIRPGRGHKCSPCPSTKSTRIESHVRAMSSEVLRWSARCTRPENYTRGGREASRRERPQGLGARRRGAGGPYARRSSIGGRGRGPALRCRDIHSRHSRAKGESDGRDGGFHNLDLCGTMFKVIP